MRGIRASRKVPGSSVACLLAASALAACGGDDGGAESPEQAVESYIQAVADGDAGAACELLTDATRESEGLYPPPAAFVDPTEGPGSTCEAAVEGAPDQPLTAFEDATVEVADEGETDAIVELTTAEEDVGIEPQEYFVTQEGGGWKLGLPAGADETVGEFLDAFAAADAEAACGLLTDDYRDSVAFESGGIVGLAEPPPSSPAAFEDYESCEERVSANPEDSEAVAGVRDEIAIEAPTGLGPEASVTISIPTESADSSERYLGLERVDGEWRIDRIGDSPPGG